ncbi:hypothetical protein [Dyadobacter diqingensis]|uniref:hypothetical protein n=1 Tax=Dyadobacter diqingensis TaxID=2938121 RepID=UPI0020C1AAB9|nr:hypothetical protein [Dyadobacter diqingensis]
MNKIEVKKYENYPDGSGGRKTYDMFYLTFQEYLAKYYKTPDLSRWNYINQKFITPLFDGTSWEDYLIFLHEVKPPFMPDKTRKIEFWEQIKNDARFSVELKRFFTFLYSIGFYRSLSFEEWLASTNWMHPWYEDESGHLESIVGLLAYNYSENFLKERLATLNIF